MDFRVRLSPAQKTNGGFTLVLMDPRAKTYPVSAGSIGGLVTMVRELAVSYGESCSAYVTVSKGARKPNGFDRAMKGLEFIEVVREGA